MKPYKNTTTSENSFIREFSSNVLEEELVWHRDERDRNLEILEGENWYIQFDNYMPEKLIKGETYYVPKNVYHRVIKGTTNLKIHITET